MDITKGSVVIAKAGRDKGKAFAVTEVIDSRTVLIADGKSRPLERPKRKNVSHTVLKLNDQEVTLSPTGFIPVTMKASNSLYYNLQGTRVWIPQKGIYIKDRKKTVIL